MATPRGPELTEFNVSLLTSVFQVRGRLPVVGQITTFVNDEQKPTLSVQGANVLGVSLQNPAATMTQQEMIIAKPDIHAVVLEMLPPNITLQPRAESLVIYTAMYAIQGRYHMSPDARVNDFVDASLQSFIVATDVRVYPLFQARGGLVQEGPLALLHKEKVLTYHKI